MILLARKYSVRYPCPCQEDLKWTAQVFGEVRTELVCAETQCEKATAHLEQF